MSSEEKIKELTERIEKLEKAENKRKAKKIARITFKIIELIILIILLWLAWGYIKPYKEKIDAVNEKVETIENYINDKFSGFTSYFKK